MAVPKHPEASKPEHKTPPKLSNKAIIWFVVFALAWVLVSMVASQYAVAIPMMVLLGEKVTMPLWTCVYDALTYVLALVLVIFVPPLLFRTYQKAHGQESSEAKAQARHNLFSTNPTELGVQKYPTFVDIGLAPIGYIVYMVLATALTTFMSIFTWFNAGEAQDVGFSYLVAGFDRIVAAIALVVIAPLAEEIIMRGWLYGKLRSKLKIIPAILLVSILFGFLHGQWNVAVSTFALSIVLCGLREITGTIWAGVLLHMLSNGIAFYLLYIMV